MTRLRDRVLLCCMWICMYTVLSAQEGETTFRYLDFRDGLPEYAAPHALEQDHLGRIWLGTDKGLFMYDGYEVTNYPPNIQDSTALSELIVQALHVRPDGTIWIGTRNMGICTFDPVTGTFSRYLPIEEGGEFPVRRIRDIYSDADGIVWVAGYGGLVRCDPVTWEFEYFCFERDWMTDRDRDFYNTFRTLRDDPTDKNILYIGTRSGLLKLDKRTREIQWVEMPFKSLEIGLEERDYLLMDMVWTSDYQVYFGSWGSGVIGFNTLDSTWTRFRFTEPANRKNIIFHIEKRDDRHLFYTTIEAAGILDLASGEFRRFPTDREERGGTKWSQHYEDMELTSDGYLVIGGSLGLSISEQPVTLAGSDTSPVPIITAIEINRVPYPSEQSYPFTRELSLQNQTNSVSFTFSWPVFEDPEDVRFRVMLEGYDNAWVDNGSGRKVQYTNLRAGVYRFHVAASADGTEWKEGLTAPEVTIHRPFTESPMFYGGLGIGLIAILGFVGLMRMRHIRRESRLKTEFNKRLAENEMTALRAQMNPHFMFNSLNSIKNYILKENTDAASKYLTKFSQLMRAILKNSKSKLISLEDELHALNLYIEIEGMRFNHAFNYTLDIDDAIDPGSCFIPPLLIQPYVENAIWHGLMQKEGDRTLRIAIRPAGGRLQIIVEDNGIGRQQSERMRNADTRKHKSFGMQITKDRIELINSTLGIKANIKVDDLEDESGASAGTRVSITVPVINEETYATSWEN